MKKSLTLRTTAFLLLGMSLGSTQAISGSKITGSGETITVTDSSVTLEGWFTGIVIGADRVHVNMKSISPAVSHRAVDTVDQAQRRRASSQVGGLGPRH